MSRANSKRFNRVMHTGQVSEMSHKVLSSWVSLTYKNTHTHMYENTHTHIHIHVHAHTHTHTWDIYHILTAKDSLFVQYACAHVHMCLF